MAKNKFVNPFSVMNMVNVSDRREKPIEQAIVRLMPKICERINAEVKPTHPCVFGQMLFGISGVHSMGYWAPEPVLYFRLSEPKFMPWLRYEGRCKKRLLLTVSGRTVCLRTYRKEIVNIVKDELENAKINAHLKIVDEDYHWFI